MIRGDHNLTAFQAEGAINSRQCEPSPQSIARLLQICIYCQNVEHFLNQKSKQILKSEISGSHGGEYEV
jgi:hypothetical protein